MDLSDIKTFLRVVQRKSFSAAAAEMRVSQSTVSKHVARLEETLGVQLLHRSTQQLSLTEAGVDFFARATGIVAELEEARLAAAALASGAKGTLSVHSTFGIGHSFVAPAVARFLESYPEISVQLLLAPGETVNVLEQDIDVTIRLSTEREPLKDQTSLTRFTLGHMRYLICGAPAYFARAGRPATPKELERHNCLVHSLQPGANHWYFEGPQGTYAVKVRGTFSSNSGAALYDAVDRGLGIARILEHVARERVATGELEAIFADQTPSSYFVTAYIPRAKRLPPKTEAFLDFLQKSLAETTGMGTPAGLSGAPVE
ncbi:MAG: LysR family transcriptional regulator [Alphaproteobacteria bacterium]